MPFGVEQNHPKCKYIPCIAVVVLLVNFSVFYKSPILTAEDGGMRSRESSVQEPFMNKIQEGGVNMHFPIKTKEDSIDIEDLYNSEKEFSTTVTDIDEPYITVDETHTTANETYTAGKRDEDTAEDHYTVIEDPITTAYMNTVVEGKARPSTHYINGKYGGKKFTPPDMVGITSFNYRRENFIERLLPDFNPEMANQAAKSLDFVIAGFPKTGTTFLTQWLNNDSINMLQREQCQFGSCTGYSQGAELPNKNPITLINRLIHDRQEQDPNGTKQKLAFKCPSLAEDDTFDELFSNYFQQTDIVIGLRHPIKWFNSFYNFRVKKNLVPVPLVYELIGSKCEYGLGWKVCTDRAKFALPLAKLGKTELSPEEVDLLVDMVRDDDHHSEEKRQSIRKFFEYQKKPSMGRIFLYELDQLADPDKSHLETFAADLTDFLQIDKPLTVPTKDEQRKFERKRKLNDTPAPEGYLHYTGETGKTRKWNQFKRSREERIEAKHRHELLQIDICDPLYDNLRHELVKEGKQTSEWLLNYFLQSPEVIVSQRGRFEELIASYGIDPCLEETE
eukprot:CAMPEP_0204636960 /NCGR_PEP_ID=MMETSP0717-20131115/35356_1 /ASSEMBLY_ACC=CAM_ASM_000666 /TAXON_ID=230516 /ORGANISM="Chaetoceros curvisetus" /LENGTH=560 /DNA_ID=CAMNT_0051656205 /DNA_START=106 /DNA_END=1788 /DNA_ORIENTATION=+